MANKNQDWDDLGRSIQDIVDRAVNSRDFQKLNQTVSQAVGKAVDMGSEAVRKAMEAAARPTTPPARPVYREVEATVVEEKKDLPVLYAGTGGETAVGLVKIVGGGLARRGSPGISTVLAKSPGLARLCGVDISDTLLYVGFLRPVGQPLCSMVCFAAHSIWADIYLVYHIFPFCGKLSMNSPQSFSGVLLMQDRKSTRLNSSHRCTSRMPSSA